MGTLADWVFPYAEALSNSEMAKQKQHEVERIQMVAETADPVALMEAYATLLSDDSERLKSVEGRLAGLLGLTSLTATLLFSGILAIANGTLGDSSRAVRVTATLCVLYLSAQIVCSTLASIRGLSRTAWLRSDVEDLMPPMGHQLEAVNRQRAVTACNRYLASDRTINYKVTQMAIAHTAVRNFAVGSAVIAVLGLTIVLSQDRSAALSKAIQKDTQLQHLLQGPPGPPGPPGVSTVCSSFNSNGQAKTHGTALSRGNRPRH